MSFNYEIKDFIISVNNGNSEWNLELNLISWNNREPKYDIRKWSPDHEKMSKGISFDEDEAILFFQQADKFLDRFRSESKQEVTKDDDFEKEFEDTAIEEVSDLPFQ
jgi:hypothetical protein